MAQYIDKDALVAKIERRFDECSSSILKHYDACKEAKAQELGKILIIINTLEVKEADLEKEIDLVEDKYRGFESLSRADVIDVAKHFFELGLKAQKGE